MSVKDLKIEIQYTVEKANLRLQKNEECVSETPM